MVKKHFSVSPPKSLSSLAFCFCAFLCLVPLVVALFQHNWNPIMMICFMLIAIPFLIGGIWVKNYRIDVEGSRVKVRRGIGTTYSFETEDVHKVIRRINHTRTGTTGKCTIYVNNHKISVESAMTGFETMVDYITEHVPANRIITKEITLSKPVK